MFQSVSQGLHDALEAWASEAAGSEPIAASEMAIPANARFRWLRIVDYPVLIMGCELGLPV